MSRFKATQVYTVKPDTQTAYTSGVILHPTRSYRLTLTMNALVNPGNTLSLQAKPAPNSSYEIASVKAGRLQPTVELELRVIASNGSFVREELWANGAKINYAPVTTSGPIVFRIHANAGITYSQLTIESHDGSEWHEIDADWSLDAGTVAPKLGFPNPTLGFTPGYNGATTVDGTTAFGADNFIADHTTYS